MSADLDVDVSVPPPMPTFSDMRKRGITASKLLEGVEFEISDDQSSAEKRELEELEEEAKSLWWTKDELMLHINQEASPLVDVLDSDGVLDFDELRPKMQVIYSDTSGKPLIYKQLLKVGVGEPITQNMTIEYHLSGYFEGSDEPFDCSRIRNSPMISRLNYDLVLKGLLVAFLSMRKFERARFLIEPEMAFGPLGCQPRIPPNASLLYCIEIKKTYTESELINLDRFTYEEQQAIPFEQLIEAVDLERISGNTYFSKKRFSEARQRYYRAISVLEERMLADGEEEQRSKEILLKLYKNSALTLIEMGKYHAAIHNCKKGMEINRNEAKLLYLYGKAAIEVGYYDLAKKYLREAHKIKPNDPSINASLDRLNNRINDDVEAEKLLLTKMGSMFK